MTTPFQGAYRNIFVLSILSLAGMSACGLLKKKGADEADAGEDAAVAEVVDAAPPPAAAPVASNVDDVARFPDEKAIDNVAATIQRITNVREIPAVGKVVATLAKGGTVTQVASRGTAFLVVFDNPKDSKRVMGWVGQEAFTALPAVDAGVKVLTCTAPEIALISDLPFCGRTCVNDPDCPAGQACKGHANKFVNAKFGDAVGVCTVFNAPTAPTRTAAVVTPPVPAVIPVPVVDVADSVGGRCAVGFQLVGTKCHKICTAAGQCRGNFKCALAGPKCGNVAVCDINTKLCL